ncbi:MAG: diguanylate cyclase [Thermoleophilia bacterium]|nr:diguanylate cyclase [Thermoleophilia bacterium]
MRRLLRTLATLLTASFVLFVLLQMGPNPLATLGQEGDVDTVAMAHRFGWDRPWYVQYGDWLGGLLHGDWGTSIRTNEPARDMVLHRVPLTLALGLSSTLLALLVAIPLATWAARRRDTPGDRWVTSAMIAMGALPTFLIALVLQAVAVKLKDTVGFTVVYVGGMPRDGGIVEYVQRFALPVTVLALVQMAGWMRYQRAGMLTSLDSDAVVAARARGVPGRDLIWRHAFRQSLGPLITLIGLEVATLIGGAVVVETVFSLPGIGRLLLESLQTRDIVVALDIVTLMAFAMVVVTAAADAAITYLDPRVTVRREHPA